MRSRFLLAGLVGAVLALVMALVALAAPSAAPAGAPLGADAAAGQQLYGQYCGACHGPDAKGGVKLGDATSADIRWQAIGPLYHNDPTLVTRAITQGLDQDGQQLDDVMPRWGTRLTAAQVQDLVAYLQTLTTEVPGQVVATPVHEDVTPQPTEEAQEAAAATSVIAQARAAAATSATTASETTAVTSAATTASEATVVTNAATATGTATTVPSAGPATGSGGTSRSLQWIGVSIAAALVLLAVAGWGVLRRPR